MPLKKLVAKLPLDATLRSAAPGLTDPVGFIRAVMGSMQNWDVEVSLDVCSDPKRPAYFLFEVMEWSEDGAPVGGMPAGWCDGWHVWREVPLTERSHGSAVSMSKYEVQCLLADLLDRPHLPARR